MTNDGGPLKFTTVRERDAAIIKRAIEGVNPGRIAMQIDVSRQDIYTVLNRARASGERVPYFDTAGRPLPLGMKRRPWGSRAAPDGATLEVRELIGEPTRPSRAGLDSKPPPEQPATVASPIAWTAEEDDRLRDMVARRVGLQAIAVTLRKPYGAVAGAIERLGISYRREAQP